jgi:phenylacetate-CoA ligase
MLIINNDRLRTLERARNEILSLQEQFPSVARYEIKLAELWSRAAGSAAYEGLGSFSLCRFHQRPVTSRHDLKAAPWSYVAGGLERASKYYETTGTAGPVTPTPRYVEDIIWNVVSVAEAWRGLFDAQDRVLVLLPSDIVPVGDLVVGVCEYLDLLHTRCYPMTAGISDWDRLIGVWRSLRPTVITVPPGLAVQLTRLLKQRELLAELSCSVRLLMLLGEVSTPAMRRRLGEWWAATAYDASYGSTETGTLATTCGHSQLHLRVATNYFEIATPEGIVPLAGAAAGRLIVTPLNLYARPLLRFDTGDQVSVGAGCRCGGGTPTVVIHGRAADSIRIHDVELSVRSVEDLVFGLTTATGYLIELSQGHDYGRLLLERDVGARADAEHAESAALRGACASRLGLRWDDIVYVNALPVSTKSGAAAKSWKRTNVRVVERVG